MQTGSLNLLQLELVQALARSGNLTAAAERLGLTQPAASHALARLRRKLQDPIFVRTSKGMRPTPYGRRLAAAVDPALQALRDGLQRREDFQPQAAKRTFNLFMSDIGQLLYLPPLLERLATEGPGIALRVRSVPAKAPHLMLEAGEVDLAIGTYTTLIAGCMQKGLFRDRYVCVARKDHPAFEAGMTREAFRSTAYALADATGYVHERLDRWLSREKVAQRAKLHVPHFLVLPLVIARSDLVAVMAQRVANLFAGLVPLKVMPPPVKLPPYDVKMFWHERFHRDPANRWLRQFVSATLQA
jgi:DNA-binding transcriptional LysR family regulator